MLDAARRHRLVVTVEDNGRAGGFGDAVCRMLRDYDVATPVKTFGIPQQFLDHGERGQILDELGLAPQHLARAITEAVAGLSARSADLAPDPDHVVDNRET
jgi:1-deoxy-D-xylulose-5-phosphate synthase